MGVGSPGPADTAPGQAADATSPAHGSLAERAAVLGLPLPLPDPWLLVSKSAYSLTLCSGSQAVKVYPVALGWAPVGQKQREGDGRTPEGSFYICQKATAQDLHDPYLGTRWMRVSYPDVAAGQRGLEAGLIDGRTHEAIATAIANGKIPPQHSALGGGIGIHGGHDLVRPGNRTWTAGCIGMYNADIEELYDQVPLGALVVIRP